MRKLILRSILLQLLKKLAKIAKKICFGPRNYQFFIIFPSASERIRTLPNASGCIRMGPNASEQVQASPKTSKNLRDGRINFKKLQKNFEQFSKNIAHGLFLSKFEILKSLSYAVLPHSNLLHRSFSPHHPTWTVVGQPSDGRRTVVTDSDNRRTDIGRTLDGCRTVIGRSCSLHSQLSSLSSSILRIPCSLHSLFSSLYSPILKNRCYLHTFETEF